MKAITLKQPWAYAITDLGKNIENRNWLPMLYRSSSKGETLAIHIGKAWDDSAWDRIYRISGEHVPPKSQLITGAIIAVCDVVGWIGIIKSVESTNGNIKKKHFVINPFSGFEPYKDMRLDKWFFGSYGWILVNVRKFRNPIPYKGALGRWDVPEIIKTVIYEEIAR